MLQILNKHEYVKRSTKPAIEPNACYALFFFFFALEINELKNNLQKSVYLFCG